MEWVGEDVLPPDAKLEETFSGKLDFGDSQDLEDLVVSEGGIRDSLVVWKSRGELMDGRRRRSVCKKLGLKMPVKYVEFEDDAEAAEWVFENQFARRNLSKLDIANYRPER